MSYTYYVIVAVALVSLCSIRETIADYTHSEALERNAECRNYCKQQKETCYLYASVEETMDRILEKRERCTRVDDKCRIICARLLPQ